MLNHHFLSSPGDSPLGGSSAHYPGRFFLRELSAQLPRSLFPRRPVSSTLPQGLGSPPNCLPRLRETPYDTRGLPCFYSTVRCHLYYPEKGVYPQITSIHRIDDRPDLSDLGWSSHYDSHTIRCGPSNKPISSNISIFTYTCVSNYSHTLLLQSYITVSNKSSLTTKISYIYHFPRETPTFTILYQSTLSIYRNTSVLLNIKCPTPSFPLSPPDATTCHVAISSANLEPFLGYPNH